MSQVRWVPLFKVLHEALECTLTMALDGVVMAATVALETVDVVLEEIMICNTGTLFDGFRLKKLEKRIIISRARHIFHTSRLLYNP